jgi:methionyl-tRNA synthetase
LIEICNFLILVTTQFIINFVNFSKTYDPEHEDLIIDHFGSLKNLNEMNFEQIHQFLKQESKKVKPTNLQSLGAQKT